MNWLDYSLVAAYLFLLMGMGYMLRHQSSSQDYFLGGRSLSWKSLTLSVMATQLSAISFVSAPAFVGLREDGGLKWLSYELAVPLAMILLLSTIMPALYRSGVVSIYDYLEQRFGRPSRVLLSVIFQFSRAFSTGIMIYAVSMILQTTMDVTLWQSIIVIGVITVAYSWQGGMKAVVYGDVIQMVIIIIGTGLCAYYGLMQLGGVDAFVAQVDQTRVQAILPDSFGFSGDSFGLLPMIFGGIVLYASYYGCDQTQAQRALSASNPKQLKFTLMANGLFRFPVTLLYCFSGLIIGTLAMTTPEFGQLIPDDKPDWMIPMFILHYLPHGVIGLLVVAILSAAMSSLSSTINSLAAVTLEDYKRLSGKTFSDKEYLSNAKYLSLFWGLVTLVLSFFGGDIAATVIEAINKVGSVFYGPILAIFLLAVLDKRLSGKHVNPGLVCGVLVNVIFWRYVPNVFWFWWNFIGLAVTLGVSWLMLALIKAQPCSQSDTPKDPSLPANQPAESTSLLEPRDIVLLLSAFVLMLVISFSLPVLLST